MHSPEIVCIFDVISALERRQVGCHYIVPQQTLRQCQSEAKRILDQQNGLPESEKLSPVALKACQTILDFKGNLDNVPVIQLADDLVCLKQAGVGAWKNWPVDSVDGKLNRPTIGIEFANSPDYKNSQHDLFRHCDKQVITLIALLKHLLKKHVLSGTDIVTHSDIAWNRDKKQPGPYFPYEALARHRLGVVPLAKNFPPVPQDSSNQKAIISWIQTCFRIMGYTPCPSTGVMDLNTQKILRAYALHFFPQCPKYQGKNNDWSALIQSLLHHPWAPFFLTKEDSWDNENSFISQKSQDLF